MIIAILKAGLLEGKIKLPERQNEIDIILPIVRPFDYGSLDSPTPLTLTPRARFIWRRQISATKHEYILKEIL